MTMQNQNHPDDERLSALAGGDPEATGDTALRAHLESCDRCTSLLRELGELRLALAQLPDMAPSRPLQLIPPVTERAASGGWLRRLAAPAMAAGAAMVVIGGVGFGAISLSGLGASGAAPAYRDSLEDAPETRGTAVPADEESDYRASGGRLLTGASPRASGDQLPAARDGESTGENVTPLSVDFNQPTPWLVLLVSGAALLLLGLVLRYAVNPRAG
jgi:anti-sigma factor RsiW